MTRSPTPGTTADSTRRSTRSPARSWTGGPSQLGDELRDGEFGENLTTSGIDVNEAEVGERWRIGTVVLEVASVRTPCNDFKQWLGRCGHDNSAWVRRFSGGSGPARTCGCSSPAYSPRATRSRWCTGPGHGVTVSYLFRALTPEPELLPRLLDVDGLVDEARAKAEAYATGR